MTDEALASATGAEPAGRQRMERPRRWFPGGWPGAAAAAAFILVSAGAALLFDTSRSDLDLFFWPSAEVAAHGHPLLVYSVRAGTYPNANGPLSLVPLSLVAALANALGVAETMRVRDALAQGVFAIAALLMAREAVLAVEEQRGRPVPRRLIGAAFLALPPLWIATIDFGHVEAPLELWLTLLGVRLLGRGAAGRAGLCLGLAVLSRSLAVVSLVPLLLALAGERRWRPMAILTGTTTLTVLAGIAPFLVADRSDTVYSLLTFRSALPIAGGSLWYAFRSAPWISAIRSGDTWAFAGAALLLCLAMVAVGRSGATRRTASGPRPDAATRTDGPPAATRPVDPAPRPLALPSVYALLTVATLCVPMLAKTTWPYYLLDPCVFATIWWLGRPSGIRTWRAIPALTLAAGDALLAGFEQHLPLPPAPAVAGGIAASAVMAVLIALVVVDRRLGPGPRVAAPRDP